MLSGLCCVSFSFLADLSINKWLKEEIYSEYENSSTAFTNFQLSMSIIMYKHFLKNTGKNGYI